MGSKPRYGSDLRVDVLRQQEIEYVALNPGASFRGLHDSLVNRAGAPEIITCPHEKIAIDVAHGYARVTGRPMVAALHNVVGLLHGSLGLFSAFIDRVPVIAVGGAGPMNTTRRRPRIDWIHSANIQGDAVRGFTKWDDQPAAIEAVPESLFRAYRVALTEPAGPVYVALDADLQEREIAVDVPTFEVRRVAPGSPIGPDPRTLDAIVAALMAATAPVIVTGYAGRDPRAFQQIPELAELLSGAIIDLGNRLNLPNRHALNVTGSAAIEEADLILYLDAKDRAMPVQAVDRTTRTIRSRLRQGVTVIDIGFNDLQVSSWIQDYGSLQEADFALTADTSVVLPMLIERVRPLVNAELPARRSKRQQRGAAVRRLHDELWASWADEARGASGDQPVAPAQLAAATWSAIAGHDWVLTAGTANDWTTRLWDFNAPYRHPGKGVGIGSQIGVALGIALAHRGKERLVVDLQSDGDLMYDAGALWVAAAQRLPLLVVMYNNRAYYNDWEHQIRIAEARGSDPQRTHLGVNLDHPAPDFAGLARAQGWYAEGPIENPAHIAEAVARAADIVLSRHQPALVDVVCRFR